MEDAILADAPGAAIGQCEAGTAAPEPARPIHKASTVYSAEFKAQTVSDFLKVRGRTTRAEFARSRGIPPGTFDGWYWKAMGLKRGHAKEPSAIAAAADYFLKMEGGLLLFMSDGRASLDNNAAERCVKKAALARRNFLFVQGEAGGESAAIALTLIETAAANRVEPMGYLRWVLSNRSAAEADPNSFLPWSDKVPEELRF